MAAAKGARAAPTLAAAYLSRPGVESWTEGLRLLASLSTEESRSALLDVAFPFGLTYNTQRVARFARQLIADHIEEFRDWAVSSTNHVSVWRVAEALPDQTATKLITISGSSTADYQESLSSLRSKWVRSGGGKIGCPLSNAQYINLLLSIGRENMLLGSIVVAAERRDLDLSAEDLRLLEPYRDDLRLVLAVSAFGFLHKLTRLRNAVTAALSQLFCGEYPESLRSIWRRPGRRC